MNKALLIWVLFWTVLAFALRCVISHVNSACSATYSVHDSHVISA